MAKSDKHRHEKRKKVISTLPKSLQATDEERKGQCKECRKTGHAKRTCLTISANKEILTAYKAEQKSKSHAMMAVLVDSDEESDCDGLIDRPQKRYRRDD